MSYILSLSDYARDDIWQGMDWYDQKKEGLGNTFYDTVWNLLILIEQMPFAFPIKHKKIRACPVKKFPFLIYYSIEENNKVVTIMAVLHTKMDWQNRL